MGYIIDSIKALFTKNTTNAASVSGARVPIMSSDGTPIGNDSLANLASVLGAPTYQFASLNNGDYVDIPNSRMGGLLIVMEYAVGSIFVFAIKGGTYTSAVKELTSNGSSKLTVERFGDVSSNPNREIRVTNVALGSNAPIYIRYICSIV